MHRQTDFPSPSDLRRPVDDDAATHLVGMMLPKLGLRSTAGRVVELSELSALRTVIYCYPMTGGPGKPLPENWDAISGARGCTPQACNFRDHHRDFRQLGAQVFGLSTQTTEYQREMAERIHLPFEVLSDTNFQLFDTLRLPTFAAAGMRVLKRLTLIVRDGRIEHVLYPVFPTNESADQVLRWFGDNPVGDQFCCAFAKTLFESVTFEDYAHPILS